MEAKVNWMTVYKTYIKLIKFNILTDTYKKLLSKYLIKTPNKKLQASLVWTAFWRVQLTDTSSIINRNGNDKVSFNRYESRKKICKISLITDSDGIPINVAINNGRNDGFILMEHIDNMLINKKLNDKHKKYFFSPLGAD